MADLIKNILTHPLWTIGTTLFLWAFLFFAFTILKLSEVNWKRLEYVWLFAGFIGLLSISIENNKKFKSSEIQFVKNNIELDISFLNSFLSESQACRKYNQIESSPKDLKQRQSDQDKICFWAKGFKINIDTLEGIPVFPLDTIKLKLIAFDTDFMDDYVKEVQKFTRNINANILTYNKYSEEIKSKSWEEFSKTFGLLLLILAFAVRLSIATRNVRNSKSK
jgi:hypothetical protein